MKTPDADAIESEFQVLNEEYRTVTFYGGAFEGSHAYHNFMILRLYSIIPESETDHLRIETRQHYAGQVVAHDRTELKLTEERTVADDEKPLEMFCYDHHFNAPREEIASLITTIEESDEYML